MGVASYGLTACSMEEIFVQLTHKEAAEAKDGEINVYMYIHFLYMYIQIYMCIIHVYIYYIYTCIYMYFVLQQF